jgi:hypothetical protein
MYTWLFYKLPFLKLRWFSPLRCSHLSTFFAINNKLLTKSVKNSDENLSLALFEVFEDVFFDITEMLFFWEVDIRLNFTIAVEELEGIAINIKELIFDPFDNWSINHITSVKSALIDLVGENIFSLQNNLGGSMLSWFGSGSFSDLARVSFNHNQGTVLESVGIGLFAHGWTGIGHFESFVVRHSLNLSIN